MTMKFTNELFKNLGKPLKNQWCLMLIMSPDRSRLLENEASYDACSVREIHAGHRSDVFYSLPSLKNSFLPKEIYNAKENREGIESTVNRSDEAS